LTIIVTYCKIRHGGSAGKAVKKKVPNMRKDITIAEMRTFEAANTAVQEIDDAVLESAASLNTGRVRPSASGLVRCASGLVRDASGLVRDASGLVRDASGLVRSDETAEFYKDVTGKANDLTAQTVQFSRYVRRIVNLAETLDASGLVRDASGLVRDASGLVRNASGLVRDASGLVRGTPGEKYINRLAGKCDTLKKRAKDLEQKTEYVETAEDASGLVRDASGLVRDASGLVRDASGLVRDASGLVR
jgi:hypothetical protein